MDYGLNGELTADTQSDWLNSADLIASTARFAHDVKSPLTALNMLLDISHDLPTQHSKALFKAVLERLNSLSESYLEDFKKTVRPKPRRTEPLTASTIGRLLEEVTEEKRLIHRGKINIRFIQEKPANTNAKFPVGKTAFRAAFANVLQNAIEANQLQGVITVELKHTETWLEVYVQDEGPGLAEDIVALGELGYTQGKLNGLGIGLNQATEAIETMGGKIECKNAPCRGATFKISIPRKSTTNRLTF